MHPFAEAVGNWEMCRGGLIAELENIPEEHWEHRPGEGARSLRELAYHVAEAGVVFTAELVRPDGALARFADEGSRRERMGEYGEPRNREELLELLRITGERGFRALRELADDVRERTMPTARGDQSRLTSLWFAVSHEWYHRGQVATYARGVGRVPVLTRQIQERMARM